MDNSLIENLVPYFTAKKYGVCTLEYRRREHDGGGWPGTNQDIVSGLKKLHENFHVRELLFPFFDKTIELTCINRMRLISQELYYLGTLQVALCIWSNKLVLFFLLLIDFV